MMKTLIAVKKLQAVVLDHRTGMQVKKSDDWIKSMALSLQANAMSLGYVFGKDAMNKFMVLRPESLTLLHQELIPVLKNLKGADVAYNPMYPNFPQQVMDASSAELFWNAILHYYSFGQWTPDYDELPRKFTFESTKFIELGLATEAEFSGVFTKIVSSNDSVSEEDKEIMAWFMDNYPNLPFPAIIPFKETMCFIAGHMLRAGQNISPMITTATDVLRVATYLSDGDISLAGKTKYVSLPRSIRRMLVNILKDVISEEDIARHSAKWVRLAHSLHVGDYSTKVYNIIKKVRENVTIETFNSKVENAISSRDITGAVKLLATRPSEFARRLDELLRMKNSVDESISLRTQMGVVQSFLKVAESVPTKILLQMLGHFQQRDSELSQRVVFPKGNVQRAQLINGLPQLNVTIVFTIVNGIREVLGNKFKNLEPLGNVYIDPILSRSPIPTQQRSASAGLVSVARGTRLPIGDEKNTLRFFIYWKGQDIDLSATMHDDEFKNIGRVSYTQLRSQKYEAYHSGDIVRAPNGACEFIDITMNSAYRAGARYIAMNVLVFNGPNFSEHEVCYAGWMTRSEPKSNEIFDPKTVDQKIDVRSETRNVTPVIFDLETREAIWLDMSTGHARTHYWGNNVESNRARIEQTVKAVVSNTNKVNLYDLFSMHATARGQLVEAVEDADTVFSLTNGVTPFDVNTIQSEYIIG